MEAKGLLNQKGSYGLNALTEFQREMDAHGLACQEPIIGDGALHRYHVPGDSPGSENGWYVLYADANPTGVFSSWKIVEKFTWTAKTEREQSPTEREACRRRVEAARAEAEQTRQQLANDAAQRALNIWEKAQPATDHSYLHKKGVQAHGIRIYEECLVVPAFGEDGQIRTLQFIDADGQKNFLRDGAKKGHYFTIGNPGECIYIGEGFATMATVHEVTGAFVVVAFDAGNLRPVAERIRREYLDRQIIISADNDGSKKGNPGLSKGKEAAAAVGAAVVYPVFKSPSTNGNPPSDFNDLFLLEGVEAVRTQLRPQDNAEEWPELIPLELQTLPEMPDNLFPKWMEDMIGGVAQATETPKELGAMLGLTALATACQRAFEIEPEPGYTEPLNTWGIAAMDSGNRKTAVLHEMTKPLSDFERDEAVRVAPEIKRIGSERRTNEARIHHLRLQAAKAKDKDTFDRQSKDVAELEASLPKIPVPPQLWVQDVTPENLATVMDEHEGVLSILSDEGGLFENIAGRYNRGVPNLDLILKAHSGSSVRIHRACRDSIDMDSPTLTMGLSPQPEILRGMVAKPGFRGCGLLARFLYVIPTSRLGFRSLESTPVSPTVKENYGAALRRLLRTTPPAKDDGTPMRYRLKLSTEAHGEWKEFSKVVEHDMRDGERFEYIRDWAGKLPGAAARVAGLLHCAAHAHGKPWEHPVELSTMENTVTLMAILAEHAIQAFELMAVNPDIKKAKKVLNWIQRKGVGTFTLRGCHRDLEGTFKRVEDLKPGVDVLIERGFIRQAMGQENRSGRPSVSFEVNPQALGRDTQ